MDLVEETIKEIAAKHGIAVGRDDPILILQTINNRLMQDSARAQQTILQQFKEELEGVAHRWGAEAKDKAERTLTAALRASKEAMATSMQEGAAVAAGAVRAEMESALRRADQAASGMRAVLWANLFASAITLAAAALVLWTVFGR